MYRFLFRSLLIVLGFIPLFAPSRATGPSDSSPLPPRTGLPFPPYPYIALEAGLGGRVVVSVTFGPNGAVSTCRLVQTSGVVLLDDCSVKFIKTNWNSRQLSGKTFLIPIVYDPGSHAKPKSDLPPPPNFLRRGDSSRDLLVRVTFDANGRVANDLIIKSNGSESLNEETLAYVRYLWHHTAYANKTLDFPIRYEN